MEMKKIMIVEDSELLHRMYDLILMGYRKVGVEVIHCYNGREAVDYLAGDDEVDIIILDVNMPVMNGLEFLNYRVTEDKYRHIPVIITSTEGKEEDVIKGLKLGATGYLTKPYRPDDLHTLMGKIIEKEGNLSLSERIADRKLSTMKNGS